MNRVHKPHGLYERFFKRPLDFTLALVALIILSPALLVLTITGAIAMKGNPFFVQKRPGRISKKTGQEKIFSLIKFRTMSNEKDKDGNFLSDEKRLNKYGRLLRSTSLDELPELLNIVKGDMAIVGPRPQLVRDMVFMTSEQRKRHTVRPGLTGLAQVNGRNNISWNQKFEFDLLYIKNLSFLFDIKILFTTFPRVLEQKNIECPQKEDGIDFGDWLLHNGKIPKSEYDLKIREATELVKK